jgi:hypothetical protein
LLKKRDGGISLVLGPRSIKLRAGGRPSAALPGYEAADAPTPDWSGHDRRIREFLGAKLVGRWKDGTSLVRYPVRPGTQNNPRVPPDNDFLLGKEDPTGVHCPFGAHVRRANPRDSRFPDSKEEIATVNRHRILRVGRAYKLGPSDEGLLFMCLNADIERQFEFVQKSWLLNANMHGLANENDPLLGTGHRQLTVPTDTGPVEIPIEEDFVRVVGGGYYFLPSRLVLRFIAQYATDSFSAATTGGPSAPAPAPAKPARPTL